MERKRTRVRYKLTIPTIAEGYCDPVELLLHASFAALGKFMAEKPLKMTDWDWNPEHKAVKKEFLTLWTWWRERKATRKRQDPMKGIKSPPLEDLFQGVPDRGKEYAAWHAASVKAQKLEAKWEKEDQAMLHRLVDIRKYLWT